MQQGRREIEMGNDRECCRRRHRAPLLLLGVLLLGTFADAQANPPKPTFRSNIELVLVPVVATDKSGNHVGGLKPSDFSVLQDGKRKINLASFEEIKHASRKTPLPSTLPAGVYSNVVAQTSEPTNLVIIALDAIDTPFEQMANVRSAVIKYLSQGVTPDTLVALVVMTRSGSWLIHDFTTDTAVLVAALKAAQSDSAHLNLGTGRAGTIASPAFQSEDEAQLVRFETGESTDDLALQTAFAHRVTVMDATSCFIQIAKTYAGVPGRKALVWFTGSVPLSIQLALDIMQGSNSWVKATDMSGEFERAWRSLEDANIAVYAVDAEGLFSEKVYSGSAQPTQNVWYGGGRPPRPGALLPTVVHQETFNTLQTFSDMTGGRAFLNSNDLARAIRSAIQDSDSYYMLGFYANPGDTALGWHKLDVRVHQKNVSVRWRREFFVASPASATAEAGQPDLQLALLSPVSFTGLPLFLRWQRPIERRASDNGNNVHVPFELLISANAIEINDADSNHLSLTIEGVVQDSSGIAVASISQHLDRRLNAKEVADLRVNGMAYGNAVELVPGEYTARLAVRDNLSGKMGSVIAPLRVQK